MTSSSSGTPAWLRCLWILPLLVVGLGAFERGRTDASATAARDREERAERWLRYSAEERDVLRERYRRFQELDSSAREMLMSGGRRLDGIARRIYIKLPARDKQRLDRLSVDERRTQLRLMAAEEAREMGEAVLQALPDPLRQRFEAAELADRLSYLERLRRGQDKLLRDVLAELSDSMELDEERKNAFLALPPERGRQQLLVLLRDYAERKSGELGSSALPEQVWNDFSDMEGREFMHNMMRLRAARPEFWPRFGARESGADASEERARMRLRLALRPDPTEHIEFLDLPEAERSRRKMMNRRDRILRILRDEEMLSPEELQELRDEPPPVLLRRVRREYLGKGRGPGGRPFHKPQGDGVGPVDPGAPEDELSTGSSGVR